MRRVLLFILIGFLLASCGKKSPPLTISESTPLAPKLKLSATQVGVLLKIELPKRNRAGYTLYSFKKLIIQKSCGKEIDTIEVMPKCHPFATTVLYLDTKVSSGICCRYRVSVEKNMFVRSPYSEWKSVCWHTPLVPPRDLSIQVIKALGILRLSWEPVKKDINGKPISGDLLYLLEELSSNSSKDFILKKPIYQTKLPKSVKCYRVKSLLQYKNTLIPGLFTPTICVNKEGAQSPE